MISPLVSLLAAPMFQTEWNGISLAELAASIDRSPAQLANQDLYLSFYRKLGERDFFLDADWLESKSRASARVRAALDAADPLWRDHGRVALAVGSGLGIVELPLVADGYRVHLQECQPESLRYFYERTSVPIENIYIGPTLVEVPSQLYDAVYFNQVVYAFDHAAYAQALTDAFRVLRAGGILAIWDPECPLSAVLQRLKRPSHQGVFWGWMRSRRLHLAFAREAGFQPLRQIALSQATQPVDADAERVLGCTLSRNESVQQELIFAKPC